MSKKQNIGISAKFNRYELAEIAYQNILNILHLLRLQTKEKPINLKKAVLNRLTRLDDFIVDDNFNFFNCFEGEKLQKAHTYLNKYAKVYSKVLKSKNFSDNDITDIFDDEFISQAENFQKILPEYSHELHQKEIAEDRILVAYCGTSRSTYYRLKNNIKRLSDENDSPDEKSSICSLLAGLGYSNTSIQKIRKILEND